MDAGFACGVVDGKSEIVRVSVRALHSIRLSKSGYELQTCSPS